MIQAFAISTIHLCDRPGEADARGRVTRKPDIRVIEAGRIFDLTQAQWDELHPLGAIREPTRMDSLLAQAGPDLSGTELAMGRVDDLGAQSGRPPLREQRRATRP